MGQVRLFTHQGFMLFGNERIVEAWINGSIEVWHWVAELP